MSKDRMPPAATMLDEMLQRQREFAAKESPKQAKSAGKDPPRKETKPEEPLRAYPVDIAKELLQPNMTETLLNAQLAEALFLVRDIGFLYRNGDADTHSRGHLINHGETVVDSSVKIADCIARLKGGGATEPKRFHYVVERVEGGGRSQKTENE